MLVSQAHISCSTRRHVAQSLLESNDESLEDTTRKIKNLFRTELEDIVNSNGKLTAGSQLHCVLAMAASEIQLDAGALESLNSSLKSAMHLANNTNISLELLGSRVCMRRLVTMFSGGSSKLRVVRPILESLASSARLYQGKEHDVMADSFRCGCAV